MFIQFLAPAVIHTLGEKDVLIVRSFSGQNAGGPTNCFTGEAPIFLADLFRPGLPPRRSTEFIPLNKATVTEGMKIVEIEATDTCLFGEDFSTKYRGKVAASSG
jgi:hypothetical protein